MDQAKILYYRSSRTGNLFKRRLGTCWFLNQDGEWVENASLFGDLLGGDLAYDRISDEEAAAIYEARLQAVAERKQREVSSNQT